MFFAKVKLVHEQKTMTMQAIKQGAIPVYSINHDVCFALYRPIINQKTLNTVADQGVTGQMFDDYYAATAIAKGKIT